MDLISSLLEKGYDIHITCEARRTEKDNTGANLPNGRDTYGLYNYKLEGPKTIESEWPGFFAYEDLLADISKKVKFKK